MQRILLLNFSMACCVSSLAFASVQEKRATIKQDVRQWADTCIARDKGIENYNPTNAVNPSAAIDKDPDWWPLELQQRDEGFKLNKMVKRVCFHNSDAIMRLGVDMSYKRRPGTIARELDYEIEKCFRDSPKEKPSEDPFLASSLREAVAMDSVASALRTKGLVVQLEDVDVNNLDAIAVSKGVMGEKSLLEEGLMMSSLVVVGSVALPMFLDAVGFPRGVDVF